MPTRCASRFSGQWADYQIAFTWIPEVEALHIACAFDLRVQERRRTELLHLVLDDQRAALGRAFRSLGRRQVAMYRHALLLTGGTMAGPGTMRNADEIGDRCLRAALSGFPVRALGGKIRARGTGQRAFETKVRPDNAFRRTSANETDRSAHKGSKTPMTVAIIGEAQNLPASLLLVGGGKMGGAMLEGWLKVGLPGSAAPP